MDWTLKMLKPTSGDAVRPKKLLANEPRKASSKPVKMLIAEEASKEAECRHHSPSIVAKLMGLDALPGPENTSKHKRKTAETSYKKMEFGRQKNQSESLIHAYQRYPRNTLLSERHPSQRYVMENEEFKDVFEIQEMPRFHNLCYPRYQDSTRSSRLSEIDMVFVRQKFMDTNHLSIDEKLQNSEEFHDVLDHQHCNKDLFLRGLREPDSLLTKQSVLYHSPSSHIAALKSSKTTAEAKLSENYSKNNIYWKRMSEGGVDMQGMSGSFLSNHDTAHFSSGRTSGYPSGRSGQSCQPTSSNHLTPTRIVVLKPRSVPQPGLSPSQGCVMNHTEQRVQQTNSQGTFEEVMNWQKLSRNSSRMNKRSVRVSSKGSREVSREVTRKLRRCVARSSFNMPPMLSFVSEEQPCNVLTAGSAHELEVSSSPYGMICHQNNKLISWPSYPTDTPKRKEAKKELPERRRLSTGGGKLGVLGRSLSTLDEMLILHELKTENKKPSLTLGYMIGKDGSCNNSVREEETIDWHSEVARSIRDFKKAGYAADMSRLRSCAVSTEDRELAKAVRGFGSVNKIVNDMISREMIMPGPQWPFSRTHSNLKEKTFMGDRHSDDYKSHSCQLVKPDNDHQNSSNDFSVMHHCCSLDGQRSFESEMFWYDKCPVNFSNYPGENSQELVPSLQARNLKKDSYSRDLLNSDKNTAEVLSTGNYLLTSPVRELPKTRVPDMKDDSPHKESQEQLSPVSILEPPFEEESSGSECFEKISAHLVGLRKQVHLHRMESSHKYAEDVEFESSAEEDYAAGCLDCFDQMEQAGLEDQRVEFMFLRDVLTSSGICGDQNRLSAWHSPDSPLNPCLFEQLNQKYSKRENTKDMWVQRSRRRLLFDRTNAMLKEILQPTLGSHSWTQPHARNGMMQRWGVRQLAEKLWEIIQNDETESRGLMEIMLAKNLVRDVKWLELRDDVGLLGADIEQALIGDLVVEMVNDLYNVTSQSCQENLRW
ncbi:uncharacterized protein LOC116256280 [Nymphaea colorata]|nr:uncharacterized protein LOC116256280 [Nymphaea colorata]XP_031488462.1 uncharacterized protein LOC116256280 [Nymphaea colorata]